MRDENCMYVSRSNCFYNEKLILKKKSPRTLKWGEYTRTRLLIKHPNQTVDYFEFLASIHCFSISFRC